MLLSQNPANKIHEKTGINIKPAFMFTFIWTVQILQHIKKDLDFLDTQRFCSHCQIWFKSMKKSEYSV